MTVKVYRITVGSIVLLIVDLIWVASSELTQYLYRDEKYDKPFFSTYVKTSMFTIYLIGLIVLKSYRSQCFLLMDTLKTHNNEMHSPSNGSSSSTCCTSSSCSTPLYSVLETNSDDANDDNDNDVVMNDMNNDNDCNTTGNDSNEYQYHQVLSDPIWVPIKFNSDNSCVNSEKSSGTESDSERSNYKIINKLKSNSSTNNHKSVRFSKLTEVRQLSESQAEEALLARLSYQATLRAQESAFSNSRTNANKLTIIETAKLSLVFCMLWFAANLSYQLGLLYSEAGLINLLSSTSSLFTIILSPIFPSNSTTDRFSLTKLIAVVISVGSVAIISTAESRFESINYIPIGGLWALSGAFFYASYIVMLRHKVNNEDSIDIPMFFGFVGLFSFLLLWPAFFILHYSQLEVFQWPNIEQWCIILVNGLVGTVLSELLWLWGCFLTSSLLASLSISLTIPLTIMFDVLLKGTAYPRLFFLGTIPLYLSFFGITLLSHYENWDPMASMLMRLVRHSVLRRPMVRVRDTLYSEQTQSLINENSA